MQRVIFIFLLIFGIGLPSTQAAEPVRELAYFHDETGGLDIHEVQQKSFKPFDKSVRLGFLRGDTWVRVTSQPDGAGHNLGDNEIPRVVRVGPHYLDHLWMYQWRDERWVIHKQGDLTAKNSEVCQDDLFCFFPSLGPNQAFTV